MEPTYVVIVDDSKQGVTSPRIIGPITDEVVLAEVKKHADREAKGSLSWTAGYAMAHVVNSESAEEPREFLAEAIVRAEECEL